MTSATNNWMAALVDLSPPIQPNPPPPPPPGFDQMDGRLKLCAVTALQASIDRLTVSLESISKRLDALENASQVERHQMMTPSGSNSNGSGELVGDMSDHSDVDFVDDAQNGSAEKRGVAQRW